MIAHRLHTITHADRILVVENGAIVESGRHDELLRTNGRYASFYRLQLSEQEPAAADRHRHPPLAKYETSSSMSADKSYVIPPPPQPAIAIAGSDRVPGPPHLVRGPQLSRAHQGDGPGRARAAVLLRQARRRHRAGRRHGALPVADQGHAPRGRAGGGAQERRPQHPGGKALDCVWGYGVGIDLTRRDLQIASRDIKRPWEIGKAFDASAPCGPLRPASEIGHPSKGRITLKCNGKVRQDGDLAQMIWNVPEVISKLSEMVALAAGDIIMTGTPSGVAATVAGDKLECEVEGVGKLTVTIGQPAK